MKYNLYINQAAAIELGITNINQALLFDLLTTASTWATPEMVDDEVYYWVARQVMVTEMPLLGLKPDTVYRHLKALAELGVIDYTKNGKKDLIRLTDKGKNYLSDTMSEINPSSYVGNESEQNSEMNPTYPTTKNNPVNINSASKKFNEFWDAYPRKAGKANARKAYEKALTISDHQTIVKALSEQVAFGFGVDKQFTAYPATWLNGERWDDEVIKQNPPGGNLVGFIDHINHSGGNDQNEVYQQTAAQKRASITKAVLDLGNTSW